MIYISLDKNKEDVILSIYWKYILILIILYFPACNNSCQEELEAIEKKYFILNNKFQELASKNDYVLSNNLLNDEMINEWNKVILNMNHYSVQLSDLNKELSWYQGAVSPIIEKYETNLEITIRTVKYLPILYADKIQKALEKSKKMNEHIELLLFYNTISGNLRTNYKQFMTDKVIDDINLFEYHNYLRDIKLAIIDIEYLMIISREVLLILELIEENTADYVSVNSKIRRISFSIQVTNEIVKDLTRRIQSDIASINILIAYTRLFSKLNTS